MVAAQGLAFLSGFNEFFARHCLNLCFAKSMRSLANVQKIAELIPPASAVMMMAAAGDIDGD